MALAWKEEAMKQVAFVSMATLVPLVKLIFHSVTIPHAKMEVNALKDQVHLPAATVLLDLVVKTVRLTSLTA